MRRRFSNNVYRDFIDAIGNTPLIRLRGASEATGCEIYGKCEFLNPGGSVKDRAALGIVKEAQARGALARGGTLVDGTAGNTGIGLTAVCNTIGARTIIVIPETQTREKKDALRQLGARLVEVPAAPYKNANNYIKVSGRLAEELGACWGRAGQESEIPNFKGSDLDRFPLVLADFWTSDHLLERSRSVDAFSGTRARETLTLKRR